MVREFVFRSLFTNRCAICIKISRRPLYGLLVLRRLGFDRANCVLVLVLAVFSLSSFLRLSIGFFVIDARVLRVVHGGVQFELLPFEIPVAFSAVEHNFRMRGDEVIREIVYGQFDATILAGFPAPFGVIGVGIERGLRAGERCALEPGTKRPVSYSSFSYYSDVCVLTCAVS